LDVWRAPSSVNKSVDIRLSPIEYDDVTNYLLEKDMSVRIMIENVQQIIDEQKAYRNIRESKANEFDYTKYHRLDDVSRNIHIFSRSHVHSCMKSKRKTFVLFFVCDIEFVEMHTASIKGSLEE
jgi:hypothetical protein